MTKKQGRKAATQPNLWVETHPLRQKPEWYTCYARICNGPIERIRVMGHYPNWGRGKVYLDRWPLDNSPMFSTYVEYDSIEVIGETLPATTEPEQPLTQEQEAVAPPQQAKEAATEALAPTNTHARLQDAEAAATDQAD